MFNPQFLQRFAPSTNLQVSTNPYAQFLQDNNGFRYKLRFSPDPNVTDDPDQYVRIWDCEDPTGLCPVVLTQENVPDNHAPVVNVQYTSTDVNHAHPPKHCFENRFRRFHHLVRYTGPPGNMAINHYDDLTLTNRAYYVYRSDSHGASPLGRPATIIDSAGYQYLYTGEFAYLEGGQIWTCPYKEIDIISGEPRDCKASIHVSPSGLIWIDYDTFHIHVPEEHLLSGLQTSSYSHVRRFDHPEVRAISYYFEDIEDNYCAICPAANPPVKAPLYATCEPCGSVKMCNPCYRHHVANIPGPHVFTLFRRCEVCALVHRHKRATKMCLQCASMCQTCARRHEEQHPNHGTIPLFVCDRCQQIGRVRIAQIHHPTGNSCPVCG